VDCYYNDQFEPTAILPWRDTGTPGRKSGSIDHGNYNRGLGITLLLEFDKRVFDCIQLALGVETSATLQDFKSVVHGKSFWSTYPYVALRVKLENELSHDSLSMANNP
jgi:hypothetical protein